MTSNIQRQAKLKPERRKQPRPDLDSDSRSSGQNLTGHDIAAIRKDRNSQSVLKTTGTDLPQSQRDTRYVTIQNRLENDDEIARAIQSSNGFQAAMTGLTKIHASSERRHIAMLNELHLKRRIFESVSNGVTLSDATKPDMPLIYVNQAFEKMTGYSRKDVLGRNCRFLQPKAQPQEGVLLIREAIHKQCEVTTKVQNRKKDGTLFWNELYLSPIFDQMGILTHYVGIQSDITARVELEQRMEHLAVHDPLTNLPNRHLMMDHLLQALNRGRRYEHKVAVLFVDVDEFKQVNDRYGHDAGDLVLKTVADRIRRAVRESDSVARLGGDEFVVIATNLIEDQSADIVQQRLIERIEQPIAIGGQNLIPRVSIGIGLFPKTASLPHDLIKVADANMYLTKQTKQRRTVTLAPAV